MNWKGTMELKGFLNEKKMFDWNESVRIEMKGSAEIKNIWLKWRVWIQIKVRLKIKTRLKIKVFFEWNEKFSAEMKVRLKLKCVNEHKIFGWNKNVCMFWMK